MNILVIPTTDWTRHPVPNRLNFIFDILAEDNQIYVLHFNLKGFQDLEARETKCNLIETGWVEARDPTRYYMLNFSSHLWDIWKAVREKEIDVILSTNIMPSFMANFAGKPIVFDYLDHLEESASIYYPNTTLGRLVKSGVRLITRYNLLHAKSVITVTEEFAQFLRTLGVKEVAVIPNGVDTSLLRPIPMEAAKQALGLAGPVIGYIGSLEHWVDLETVVQALPSLEVTLLVVGPGLFTDYGDGIRSLARSLGVENKVIFAGAVRYADLKRYISAMDIGLNPLKKMKKNEITVGGKVFNYLSCGRPVLSSRTISLERLLGDELFYYDDAKSFISQCTLILGSEPDERRHRAVAQRYDWRKLAQSYGDVLRKEVTG